MYPQSITMLSPPMIEETKSFLEPFQPTLLIAMDQDTPGDTWTMENKSPHTSLGFFSQIKTTLKNLTRSKEQHYTKIDSSSGIKPRTSGFISTIAQYISKAQALLTQKTTQRPPLKNQTTTNQRKKLEKIVPKEHDKDNTAQVESLLQ